VRRSEFGTGAGAALVAALVRASPPAVGDPAPRAPQPAPSFAEACARIRAIIARDAADPAIEKAGLPRLYVHAGPVRDAIVLFHGFTNCPQQFDELARVFFERGCNVYVPLIPEHGKKDRLTRDLADLTLPGLQSCAVDAYQLARGLGTQVSAVGLSLGGSLALYLAQTQPIGHAVPIAPFLMPIHVPRWFGDPAMRALDALPDQYLWWDPRVKADCLPLYAYPGFPTHGLAQCVFVGTSVFDLAAHGPPQAKRCTLVTNADESAVNNGVARGLLATWGNAGATYDEVVLSGLGPPRHDIIDLTTFPAARTLVYPRLVAIVLGDRR
jgi:pimeloyl-ACP methyl ester carboxylesterase